MTLSIRDMRRVLACTCVAALLSGCQIFPEDTDIGQIRKIVSLTFSAPHKVTLEEAAAIPYASIGFQIDDGAQGILVLATDNAGQRLWTSATHIAIVTEHGHIMKTAGFPHNLGNTYPAGAEEAARNSGITRVGDFPDLGLYGVGIFCEEQRIGAETITLLGKPIQTVHFEEHCHSDKAKLAWRFTNLFWRDLNSEFVWRSEQYVHPKLGRITLEILRPPE
jgi:hypothetical protein